MLLIRTSRDSGDPKCHGIQGTCCIRHLYTFIWTEKYKYVTAFPNFICSVRAVLAWPIKAVVCNINCFLITAFKQ